MGDDPESRSPNPDDDSTVADPHADRLGGQIGPYRILEKVGEGGMGEVWLAEQLSPVRRRVALKVIKQGMDTKHVIARFEAERQALAMMDHPAVAKVFDAGATPEGRPYFAMEYVKGVPITEHCDRHRLDSTERLRLFVQVCEGVQHAHQKAIIHRDLKPSNVLVTEQDGKRFPKIIDFGVAKATAQRLTEKTMFTELGVLIGTPEYMSPEQADLTGEDVDTRTDVYSLGVMLYELLVGALPFDRDELRSGGFEGIRKKIREVQPPKPSTRIRSLGERSTESARRRRVDLATLQRQIRGDLDWITMRALEKDRARRYGSPMELAADIERHIRHEPVAAGPPSTAYAVGKFIRRHRLGVLASAAIVLGLATGLVVATAGMVKARRAEDAARRSESSATEVANFMVGVFDVSDPSGERGSKVTARELLDEASDRIERGFGGDPLLRARLEHTMGRVYHSLGLYDRTDQLLNRALAERRRLLGDQNPDVAETLRMLGVLRASTGAGTEAIDLARRALSIDQAALGEDHVETAWSHYQLAAGLSRFSTNVDETEDHLRLALRVFEREYGADSQPVAWCFNDLGNLSRVRGRELEAITYQEKALAIKERVLRPDHPDLAKAYMNLAQPYAALGRHAEARKLVERGRAILETAFGPTHPDVGLAYSMVSLACARSGDAAGAREADEKATAILEPTLGLEHPFVSYQRACLLALLGDRDDAIDWLSRATRNGMSAATAASDDDLASLRGDPRFEAIVGAGQPQEP